MPRRPHGRRGIRVVLFGYVTDDPEPTATQVPDGVVAGVGTQVV